MTSISSMKWEIISHPLRQQVWEFRAPERLQNFEQLLLQMGQEVSIHPCDIREEDYEEHTKNMNERSVPYTSVAH